MFNFDFYFFMYFLKKSHTFNFKLMNPEQINELNLLNNFPDIQFIFNKKLKFFYFLHQTQLTLLFLSFVFIGFFLFSSLSSILYVDNIFIAINITWNDFINFHYVSLFICFLTLFSFIGIINLLFQLKITKIIYKLKKIEFPLHDFMELFESDLYKVERTPLFNLIISNNNLYGLILFLIFAKHLEQQELKLIPLYWKRV